MKYTHFLRVGAPLALFTLFSVPAAAHIQLDYPSERATNGQKSAPCGNASSTRGDNITIFEPGETITVTFHETINHPAHYRISFDDDGQDAFGDPPTMMDYYSNDAVLVDEIPDDDSRMYAVEVTLPDIECDNCTLQVIQVMYDKQPYGDGNDLYYRCADIELRAATGEDMGSDAPDMGAETDMGTSATNNANATNNVNAANNVNATNNVNASNNAGGDADMGVSGGDGEDDASEDDEGCSAAGAAASWPALLLVLGFWRRRKD